MRPGHGTLFKWKNVQITLFCTQVGFLSVPQSIAIKRVELIPTVVRLGRAVHRLL